MSEPNLDERIRAVARPELAAERDALAARVEELEASLDKMRERFRGAEKEVEELEARIARAVYALSDFALTDKQAVERALPILRGEDER